MSHLDSELNSLRLRLVALEEQKQIETEIASEKKAFPLKTLNDFVDKIKSVPSGGTNKFQNERYNHARAKLEYLQPILDTLKNIQERLEALEKKE
jgi:hypothetical protein